MPQPGELVFAAPRRAKPPRHLADLSAVERRDVVESLGQPGYRANQVGTHYFARLVDDPAHWTDVPAAARDALAAALTPPLLTAVREQTTDVGSAQVGRGLL